jgi:hypothetical protein
MGRVSRLRLRVKCLYDFGEFGSVGIARKDTGGAGDAGQGIADLVGQSGGELADGIEAFGALHVLEVVLEFLVHNGSSGPWYAPAPDAGPARVRRPVQRGLLRRKRPGSPR